MPKNDGKCVPQKRNSKAKNTQCQSRRKIVRLSTIDVLTTCMLTHTYPDTFFLVSFHCSHDLMKKIMLPNKFSIILLFIFPFIQPVKVLIAQAMLKLSMCYHDYRDFTFTLNCSNSNVHWSKKESHSIFIEFVVY